MHREKYTPTLADGVTFAAGWRDDLAACAWDSAGVAGQILGDDGTVKAVKASVAARAGPRFARLRVMN